MASSSSLRQHRQQESFEFLLVVPESPSPVHRQIGGSSCDARDATPHQLIQQVAMATEQWTQIREQLQEQRAKLEALRDLAASKDNRNDGKNKDHRSDSTVSLETERARHKNELRELQQRHQVAMETERAKFLARFEELEQQQKRLARQEEFKRSQMDAAADELQKATTELEYERAAARQTNELIQKLQAELSEAAASREKLEAEKAELEKRLQELTENVCHENAERFRSMADRNLSLLDELASLKRQLEEVRHEDWNIVPPDTQQCTLKSTAEGNATNLRELQEEVTRLRQREADLLQRCTDSDRIVDDVIQGAEWERTRLKAELTQLQASQKEAAADYAEKIKLKARTELQLREQISDLTRQLAELKSHPVPAKPRRL